MPKILNDRKPDDWSSLGLMMVFEVEYESVWDVVGHWSRNFLVMDANRRLFGQYQPDSLDCLWLYTELSRPFINEMGYDLLYLYEYGGK